MQVITTNVLHAQFNSDPNFQENRISTLPTKTVITIVGVPTHSKIQQNTPTTGEEHNLVSPTRKLLGPTMNDF